MMNTDEFASVDELRKSLIGELIKSVGLPETTFWRRLFSPLFWLPTRRLALVGSDFDRSVARGGIHHAMQNLRAFFVSDVEVIQKPQIPNHGPLLILTNHPGTYDAVVVSSQIPRDDLKIVSSSIPFIEKMKVARRHFLFATRDTYKRMLVIKNVIDHLKTGGAILIFPGGHIEPEPAFMLEALGELENWSRAVDIFVRKVPETQIQVGIVSNVLREKSFRNPLTRLRRQLRDRQRIGEFIQVISQLIMEKKYSNIPKVSFADSFTLSDISSTRDTKGLMPYIIKIAKEQMCLHIPETLNK